MHLLVGTLGIVPQSSAVEHNERQAHINAPHERHHGGWSARRGNGKERTVLNQSIEAFGAFGRHQRLSVEQGAVEIAHI